MEKSQLKSVKVCNVDELPVGQSKCINVDGKEIGIFNTGKGVYAINNICIHAGGPLHEGPIDCDKGLVSCCWHAWTFDLATGKCVSHPRQDVFAETYNIKIINGEVFVEVNN